MNIGDKVKVTLDRMDKTGRFHRSGTYEGRSAHKSNDRVKVRMLDGSVRVFRETSVKATQ